MNYLSILSFALAFASLAAAFIVLAISYARIVTKFRRQRQENDYLRQHAREKATELLESARDKGLQIISEANTKAKDILTSTYTFNANADETLQRSIDDVSRKESDALEQITRELLADYQKGLDEIKQDSITVFRTASKDMEGQVLTKLQDYIGLLEKETAGSQKIVDVKLQEAYDRITKELEAYKTDKMKKFDEKFYEALQIAMQDVLGRTLRMDDQQQIILESLQKAKADMQKALSLT